MTATIDNLPVHVIWGTAPDTDYSEDGETRFGQPVSKPLEVEIEKDAADAYVMRGVFNAFQSFLGTVKPGGTISVMIARGRAASEEEPEPPTTTASFVISNPDGRHVWDFMIERRKAVR